MNAAPQNVSLQTAALPYASRALGIKWPRMSPEGLAASASSLTGWLYMSFAHTITSDMAWVLFLFALASFILSIFATVKHSRLWALITLVAFVLLLLLAASTEGCIGSPCPL